MNDNSQFYFDYNNNLQMKNPSELEPIMLFPVAI
jgi:hypothetical protein